MDNGIAHRARGGGALLIGLGLAAAAVGGYTLARRLAKTRPMPLLSRFQAALATRQGEIAAAMLTGRAQARYTQLDASRPRFAHPALRRHVQDNILPGLALYQVMREEHPAVPEGEVLAEMDSLFEEVFGRLQRRLLGLGNRALPLPVFRKLAELSVQFGFPPEGWEIEWLDAGEDCVAFDIHRCFYLDVLTAYGTPELTPLYCKLDDYLYEQLPAPISWERTGTLARGDDCCDFQWCWREAGTEDPLPEPGL